LGLKLALGRAEEAGAGQPDLDFRTSDKEQKKFFAFKKNAFGLFFFGKESRKTFVRLAGW
jgi:hypothetical protein